MGRTSGVSMLLAARLFLADLCDCEHRFPSSVQPTSCFGAFPAACVFFVQGMLSGCPKTESFTMLFLVLMMETFHAINKSSSRENKNGI